MAASAGTVTINLDANSVKMLRELQKASNGVKRFHITTGKVVNALAIDFKKLTGGLGALASVGTFVGLTKSAATAADQLAKTAQKLGTTTEALKGLQLAGELTGVATSKLDMGLQRMTRRIAEAAQGTGEAQGALRQLNLDATELARLPVDKQFEAIAGAMEGVESAGEKVRLSFKLFDSEGVDLVRTLGLGSEALAKIKEDAIAYGTALSQVDAKKIERMNDAIVRAKEATKGAFTRVAVLVAPFVETIANAFEDATKASNGFSSQLNSGLEFAIRAAGFLADVVRGLQVVFLGTKAVVQELWGFFLEGIANGASAIQGFVDWVIEKLAGLVEKIPGIGSVIAEDLRQLKGTNLSDVLGDLSQDFSRNALESWQEFRALLMEPLPGDQIEEKLRAIAARSAAAAKEAVDQMNGAGAVGAEAAATAALEQQKRIAEGQAALATLSVQQALETAAAKEAIDKTLNENLLLGQQELQTLLTEIAVTEAARRVEAKLAAEAAAREAAGLPAEGVNEVEVAKEKAAELTRIANELATALAQAKAKSAAAEVKTDQQKVKMQALLAKQGYDASTNLLTAFAGNSKKVAKALFLAEKAYALGTAIMDTSAAIMKAYTIDPTGAMAARVGIVGALQIAAIAATAFTGAGGGAPGAPSISEPTTYASAPANAGGYDDEVIARGAAVTSAVTIQFLGDVFGWDDYIQTQVIAGIRDAVENRDEIIITPGTRQADELGGG